jgi:ATP-dependent RNA helicase DeaD
VTKKDIGLIKIFDHETKFEISPEIVDRFHHAIRAAADAGEIRITSAGAPGPQGPRPGGRPHSGPPRKGPPHKAPPRKKPR